MLQVYVSPKAMCHPKRNLDYQYGLATTSLNCSTVRDSTEVLMKANTAEQGKRINVIRKRE